MHMLPIAFPGTTQAARSFNLFAKMRTSHSESIRYPTGWFIGRSGMYLSRSSF